MGRDPVSASDGFAFAMLAVIAASFGVIVILFLVMRRQSRSRDQGVDDLLQELERSEKEAEAGKKEAPPPPPPWERKPDWWKDRK